jgi:hypothetical protein
MESNASCHAICDLPLSSNWALVTVLRVMVYILAHVGVDVSYMVANHGPRTSPTRSLLGVRYCWEHNQILNVYYIFPCNQ